MPTIEGHPGPAQPLETFIEAQRAGDEAGPAFRCESARLLRIDLDGEVWLKPGAAIAYRGEVGFERRPTLEATDPVDAVLREVAPLVRARGRARLYCGSHGSHVRLVRLDGESLVVAWAELLAFESSLGFAPELVAHGVSVAAGGLAVVRLSGQGVIALATHGQPIALAVTPESPLNTDPHATLAWSATLEPTLKTDLSWRSLVGHGGHEAFQMHFAGTGVVFVQPFEDSSRLHVDVNPLKRMAALLAG